MGNDKLYHQVGGLFTTTSAVMIPIGQTQSVTKGLAEFAIGEVGGFVGAQAGYYGTKLLGGSEADAERATFVGSILGGFAASSAASRFSLNEPVRNLKRPELMEELANSGYKYDVDAVILVNKNTDGKLLWLEKGTSKAGYDHIVLRHGDDFENLGITDIPQLTQKI
ncbi:hypothetical protein [Streptococcus suis]|uniref:hypothetical protein n=1 Tax=Streptococcus suis TaxID=1307 RepID=UPI001EE74DD3|nr:hypothetical protein [Streptococcus suis]